MKDFKVPSTWPEAIRTFLGQSSMQFTMFALLSSGLACILQGDAFVVADLGVVLGMAIFWYVQEWLVHHSLFHGNDGASIHPFGYHDVHHDIPYFHVATDSLRVCATWFAGVATIAGVAIKADVVPISLAIDAFATYTLFGLVYETSHYLSHTKVPLNGILQYMRKNHVMHHTTPTKYLSMNPVVDNIMGSTLKTTQGCEEKGLYPGTSSARNQERKITHSSLY